MRLISLSLLAAATLATTACSPLRLSQPPDMKLEYPEVLVVLTRDHTLLTVQASRPDHVLDKHTLTGLREGDRILGIDYRPKNKKLYAFGALSQVYEVDTQEHRFVPLGSNPYIKLAGSDFGVNIDPDTDQLRVVSDKGLNVSFALDSGLLASTNNATRYTENDVQEEHASALTAIAHTYNKVNDRMTTAFVVDKRLGMLARLGSEAGREPVLSPNTGWLSTIGPLGPGALGGVHLDVSLDTGNAFFITKGYSSVLYRVDLKLGKTTKMGAVAGNEPAGFALQPYGVVNAKGVAPGK